MASNEGAGVTTGQPNLHKQDLLKLDVTKLTALSPEVISRQATINIGTIGHVAHGKSTVVKAISGVQTVRFKNELERNITIKLERLQFDENGKITWPKHLQHVQVDLSTLLDMLEKVDLNVLPDKLSLQQQLLRLVGTPPKERHVHKLEQGKKAILLYQLVLKREVQLQKLREWEEYINSKAKEEAVIKVENNVDLEHPPEDFVYINEYIAGNNVEIPYKPASGCDCDECGPRKKQCCGRQDPNSFTYRKRDKINIIPGMAIYECNDLCKCGSDCRNRVVQKGRKVPLCIFRTDNGCGWGVKALRKIHYGEFICEYVGEVITHEEAEIRGQSYDARGLTYLFDLDYNSKDNPFTVDAAKYGNVSHFINHSCEPNLAVWAVWINCSDPNLPQLALFALREIEKGEELTFDYMTNNMGSASNTPEKSRPKLQTPEKNEILNGQVLAGKSICKCSADSCRYANAKIYKCDNPKCPRPACYISGASSKDDSFPCLRPACTGRFQLVRHVSFVDCPGHDILMATMLNGAAVMDAALLLIAGNESCPQPQTSEHLAAIEIMKLKHIIILQNKIDLVKEGQAKEQHEQIVKFVQGTVAEGAPIIPISAQLKYNIEVLCEYITKKIPIPVRDFTSQPRLIVIRSFDVNKPGCEVNDLKGGVAGGSILRGVLKVGQEIEVRPGLVSKDAEGKLTCRPIFSRIVSLYTEQNELQFAVPGGLIGVGTKIEPTLCRADRLVGQVLGAVGALPSIFIELEVSYYLLKRLLGVRTEGDKKGAKVQKLTKSEVLLVNIGSLSTGGRVVATKADLVKIALTNPVCTEVGEKIALSRRVEKHWRLIGWGQIRGGETIEPSTN
ncbi:uncharacterized protein BDFB_001236 [Asbolus verrucosus]|uniref:protein-synthesizing GTPase n=1 Tax=Asbolus verrucosus TaxID=1661398 RepID=A0A482VVK9_ASBVE|nr:uncharacterized protein BDFB_001236 [Asbolus verrucosus]